MWAWQNSFVDELKPKQAAPALRFGGLVHRSMERYYKPGRKRGPHPATTFLKLYEAELKEQVQFGFYDHDGKWEAAGEMGVAMLEHYVEHWGDDGHLEVLAAEVPFQTAVRTRSGRVLFYYVGIIDLVVRDHSFRNKPLFLIDHKTTKNDPTKVAYLSMDEQAGSYWTFGVDWLYENGILLPKQKLRGITFNYLRKAKKDERPVNELGQSLNSPKKDALVALYELEGRTLPAKGTGSGKNGSVITADLVADLGDRALLLGEVSEKQPLPYFHREEVLRDKADGDALRERARQQFLAMAAVRRGDEPAWKSPSYFNCGSCEHREICELHEVQADWKSMRAQTHEHWNPYSEHSLFDRN